MTRRTGLLLLALTAAGLALAGGCSAVPDPWEQRPGKRVLTSFAPYYCFARNVAGDDAQVKFVMADKGPHGFNPGPRDIMLVKRADLFLINGLELDDGTARKMIDGAGNKTVRLVEAAAALADKDLREMGEHSHDPDDDDHEHHHHGRFDPHIWLGLPEAVKIVGKIRDELTALDPEHAAGYDRRAKEYIAKLETLHADGKELLKGKTERKLVSFHESLGYFARSFDLTIVGSIEIAPGVEPRAKKIDQLIKACQENHVRVIAVEPQYPSNTFARVVLEGLTKKGVDAVFVEIDPLETARPADLTPDFYEQKMRQNLKALADHLK